MKKLTEYAGILCVVAIAWHIKVACSSDKKLSGLFKERPNFGYVWKGTDNGDERYFWRSTDVVWHPGQIHPKFHAYTSETRDLWYPSPGYVFILDENGKATGTKWQKGLRYFDMQMYSMEQEDSWGTVVGYNITQENGEVTGTVWEPGLKSDDYKVIAGQKEGEYKAYAGYTFKYPQTNRLDVVWTPGLTSPDNPNLISGTEEGSWVYNYQSSEPSAWDHGKNAIAFVAAGKIAEWLFGDDNKLSNELYKEGAVEGLKGIARAVRD